MTSEIQVLAWDRHTNVQGLNCNAYINKRLKKTWTESLPLRKLSFLIEYMSSFFSQILDDRVPG